jgi:putative ATP-dependent endonuclease of the OLD family
MKRWASRYVALPVARECKQYVDKVLSQFTTNKSEQCLSSEGACSRALGVGSARPLIAGFQRKPAAKTAMILVDETEHGVEPHRIIRSTAPARSAPL